MSTSAQNNFRALLLNQVDATFVPYASVNIAETGFNGVTDAKGEFTCVMADSIKKITLTVAAIGFKKTFVYKLTGTDPEKIYVELLADALTEVTVMGITPVEVVRRAVAAIPVNFKSEPYYAFSFYRQFQHVNSQFINLIEAQPVVKFDLAARKRVIAASESYAADQVRRSTVRVTPVSLYENFLARHMKENPVYHLEESSLNPDLLDDYKYQFDTTSNATDYVINYISLHFSSEHHGIDKYTSFDFDGESWETGKLVIDKKTYAIKHYKRNTHRYPKYHYSRVNNLVQPDMEYSFEFVNGELVADYVQFEGKWYLKRLLHKYTNEFYRAHTSSRDFVVSDVFEWYSNAVLDKSDQKLPAKFHATMSNKRIRYDPVQWLSVNVPCYFYNKDMLYKDIQRMGPLQTQFLRQGISK